MAEIASQMQSAAELPVVRIRPPRRWAGAGTARGVGLPRVAVFLGLARRKGALQADRVRHHVGGAAAAGDKLIFTVIFGNLAKIPSENLSYAAFAMAAGLIPWSYFFGAFARGGASLVASSNLISKVYFPRLIIRIASMLRGLIDSAIIIVVLLVLTLFHGIVPTWAIVMLSFFLLLALGRARSELLALHAQRAVSRCRLPGAVHRAVLDVRHAGGLSREHDTRQVAAPLQSESDDERGGRFSLGALWYWRSAGVNAGSFGYHGADSARQRCVLLQADGRHLRGCSVLGTLRFKMAKTND